MQNYDVYTDQQLADLLRSGDQAAFAQVYDRYHSLLYIHAMNKLQQEDEARDVVQEIFVRLWEKRMQINISGTLQGYLYRAVRNQIFDLIRHKKVTDEYTNHFLRTDTISVSLADHLIREKQLSAMIEAEIASLPSRMRQVFELRRFEDLSNKEVAERMGITENTVADQMRKAMKILRIKIGLIIVLAHIGSRWL